MPRGPLATSCEKSTNHNQRSSIALSIQFFVYVTNSPAAGGDCAAVARNVGARLVWWNDAFARLPRAGQASNAVGASLPRSPRSRRRRRASDIIRAMAAGYVNCARRRRAPREGQAEDVGHDFGRGGALPCGGAVAQRRRLFRMPAHAASAAASDGRVAEPTSADARAA